MVWGRGDGVRTASGVVVVVVEDPAVKKAFARILLDEAVVGGSEGAAGVESGCSEKRRLHLRGVRSVVELKRCSGREKEKERGVDASGGGALKAGEMARVERRPSWVPRDRCDPSGVSGS